MRTYFGMPDRWGLVWFIVAVAVTLLLRGLANVIWPDMSRTAELVTDGLAVLVAITVAERVAGRVTREDGSAS